MVETKTFRGLRVWQKAHQFTLQIYWLTKSFPADEKFGLVSQMRRAAVSIPANLAASFVRKGKLGKVHFYNIAQGSLEECKYYLILSGDLGYTKDITVAADLAENIGRLLHGLIASILVRS